MKNNLLNTCLMFLLLLSFKNEYLSLKSATITNENGKYGLTDRNNNKIQDNIFSSVIQVNKLSNIHLFSYKKEDGKYAFVYEVYKGKNQYVWHKTEFEFDTYVNAYYFSKADSSAEKYLAIIYTKNGLKGIYKTDILIGLDDFDTDIFITDTIQVMLEPTYKEIDFEFTGNMSVLSDYLIVKNEMGLKGLLQMPTGIVYPPKYEQLFLVKDVIYNKKELNYRSIVVNDKMGRVFLDTTGNYVELVPPIFNTIEDLITDTLFYATRNDTVFIYDATNYNTIRPKFENYYTKNIKDKIICYAIPSKKIVFSVNENYLYSADLMPTVLIYDYLKDSIVANFSSFQNINHNELYYVTRNDTVMIYNVFNNKTIHPKYGNQFLMQGKIGNRVSYLTSNDKIVFEIIDDHFNDKNVFSEIFIYNISSDSIELQLSNLAPLIQFESLTHFGQSIGIIINNVYDKNKKRFIIEIFNLSNPSLNYTFIYKKPVGITNLIIYNKELKNYELQILTRKSPKKVKSLGYYNLNNGKFREYIDFYYN
jgi:hypothetical protein